MTEQRYMDVAEFRRLGYLQEVNRRLLHPLGLALEVAVGPDGTETLGRIQDHRDDPEGAWYGPGVIDGVAADRIEAELMARAKVRRERLGDSGECFVQAVRQWADEVRFGPLPHIAEPLVVQPGDTLIVRVPTSTSMDQANVFKEQIREHVPGVDAKVIAAEQLAVYRPRDNR